MFNPLSKSVNNNRGFTIVELLVAIVIMGSVLAIATTMIVQSFNVFRSSTYRMSAGQMAEMAVNRTSLYLRSAVEDEDNIFGCLNDDNNIEFYAYHPDHEEVVKIKFELEDNDLTTNAYDDLNEFRLIAYGVEEFCIEQKNGNKFSLSIQYIDDEGNVKTKRTNVKSRNIDS